MRRFKSLGGPAFSISLLAVVLLVWLQRQAVYDWLRLYNYQPPTTIAQLASATTMNDSARHLFYVQHPEINDKPNFNDHCREDEHTIVLGCYVSGRGIYLLDVNDPRLAGVEEVTAAHELLHAAYDRLGGDELQRVRKLITTAYDGVSDQRLRDTVEAYRKAGADTVNELHSILGTEVLTLPTELEAYYGGYFTNRMAIVGYSNSYQKAFSDRKAQADNYLVQMQQLKQQLQTSSQHINQTEQQLKIEAQATENERTTTQDVAGFNAKVRAYNAKVAQLKIQINTYNQLVAQHNALLDAYNAIAFEENELIKAIDSRPSTLQAQ